MSNACSSCESLVAFTMEKLKALGEYDKNAGCHVVVGSKRDDEMPQGVDPNDVILIGDCVKRFRGKGSVLVGRLLALGHPVGLQTAKTTTRWSSLPRPHAEDEGPGWVHQDDKRDRAPTRAGQARGGPEEAKAGVPPARPR
jgi:hypothetical protein